MSGLDDPRASSHRRRSSLALGDHEIQRKIGHRSRLLACPWRLRGRPSPGMTIRAFKTRIC